MINETIDHLKLLEDEVNGGFVLVDNAYEADPIEQVDEQVPALLVVPGTYKAFEPITDNRYDQQEEKILGLWLVCRVDEFEARRNQVINAIQGFMYSPGVGGFRLTDGATKAVKGSHIWFEQLVAAEGPDIS